MRRVLPMGVLLMLLLAPAASACETEVARLIDGEAPSPEGLSPAKDAAIREATTIAEFGQETARWMLWRVLMGEEFTEAEIAEEIDRAMIRNGSNPIWPSFETIVASGPNGAIPHGDPEHHGAGPRIVQPGDVVVVDLGARVQDWVSDVTRTYVIGGTDNETIIKAYMA
ncbi:MAG: M24 family metallopeptidase, partial [Candidatus Poseidoniaceae archaeon]